MSSSDDDFRAARILANSSRKRVGCNLNGAGLQQQHQHCNLCNKNCFEELDVGQQPLLECGGIRAHYLCLLFSSGLGQSGSESEGLSGFMPDDVRRELKRGSRLKCVYCKLKGATVGCARQQCKKSYHLPCGMANGSMQQFFDQFKSYCSSHRPSQKTRSTETNPVNCGICQEKLVGRPSPNALWARCCSSWLHRKCVQTLALKQRHFLCPTCNNVSSFTKEMLNFGIYLPHQESLAAGPDPINQNRRTKSEGCRAKICLSDSTESRQHNEANGKWQLIACHTCNASWIHAFCGGMDNLIEPEWYCYACRREISDEHEVRRRCSRPINEMWGSALGVKPITSSIHDSGIKEKPVPVKAPEEKPLGQICLEELQQLSTVTITPLPAHNAQASNPRPSADQAPSTGGVEIRMIVPNKSEPTQAHQEITPVSLSLEDIIVAGLNKGPRKTDYQCTKAFAEKYDQPRPVPSKPQKRSNSVDAEQASPGDSDYESAQEGLPFKIRKKTGIFVMGSKEKQQAVAPTAQTIDLKIQKTIKDFFQATEQDGQCIQGAFKQQSGVNQA